MPPYIIFSLITWLNLHFTALTGRLSARVSALTLAWAGYTGSAFEVPRGFAPVNEVHRFWFRRGGASVKKQ